MVYWMGSEKAMVNLIYCDKGESLGRPHWPGFFFGGGGLFIGAFKVVFGSCFPFCFGRHTGFSSEIGTKLRELAVGQAGGRCYSQAKLSSNDSKTL